jgi:hypothetical protein
VPTAVPGPAVTANGPGPVQGRPVSEFLPNGGISIVLLDPGETGTGGGWVTVFPLSIGLVVFPLRIGLLVFCASAIVVVALRTRTLRPISAMRFTAMSDLLVVAPDTNRNTSDFLDCPEDKRRRLSRQAAGAVACADSGRCPAFPRSFELGYFGFGFRS